MKRVASLVRWQASYSTILICLLAGMLAVAVADGFDILDQALPQLGIEWLFGMAPILGMLLFFTILERWVPAGPAKSVRGWVLNVEIMFFAFLTGPFTGALLGVCIGYLSSTVDLGFIDLRLPRGGGVVKSVIAFLVSVLIFDFFYYWAHRFQHENMVLWQQHKLHHMDEQLSATTVARDHWLEGLFQTAVIAIPMALIFKLNPATGGVFGATLSFTRFAWLVFIHSNLRVGFGFLSRLVTSPQLHRIHHSRLLEHRDKNFAAYFPVWDLVFGTYFHPKRDEYPATGVHDEKDVERLADALVLPFREWSRMFHNWRNGRLRSS